MNYNRASYRYAKATIASCDKNEVMKIFADMQTVCKAFEDSNELKLFVDSKVIKDFDKLSTLKEVFQQSSKKVFDLMELLMKNRRIDLFDDVAKSFIVIYNKMYKNQDVIITSSSVLSSSTIEKIELKAKELTSKNIKLINNVDSSIVGGFILRIGDLQYDASFKNQLNKLKQDFINISIQ